MGDRRSGLDDRIAAALAESELRALYARYADAVTRRAWAVVESVIHPDCSVALQLGDDRSTELHGASSVVEFLKPAVARFEFFEVTTLNLVVESVSSEGTLATARWYLAEVRQTPDGERSVAYGRYVDRCERIEGGWWFTDRQYTSLARGVDGESLTIVSQIGRAHV